MMLRFVVYDLYNQYDVESIHLIFRHMFYHLNYLIYILLLLHEKFQLVSMKHLKKNMKKKLIKKKD